MALISRRRSKQMTVVAAADISDVITAASAPFLFAQKTTGPDGRIVGEGAGRGGDSFAGPDNRVVGCRSIPNSLLRPVASAPSRSPPPSSSSRPTATTFEDYLHDVSNRCVRMPDEVFRSITGELAEGNQAGESVGQLRDRVRAHLDVGSEGGFERWAARAETIARTESTGAYNSVALQAGTERRGCSTSNWTRCGSRRWTPAPAEPHFAADGQRRPMNAMFDVGRANLRYPGESRSPAGEVINCRCSFVQFRGLHGHAKGLRWPGWTPSPPTGRFTEESTNRTVAPPHHPGITPD